MTGEVSKALAVRGADERDISTSLDYARKLSASELLPASYQGKPQNVLVAIEYGRSIGVDPITAINMVHVIKGKPSTSAQLMGALVRRAGHKLRVTWDGTTATATVIRSDDEEFTFSAAWTMDRAKEAGLTGNATYKNFGPNMLKARAISEVVRDACPEVLAGISYTPEELGAADEPVLPATDGYGVVVEEITEAEIVDEDALFPEDGEQ